MPQCPNCGRHLLRRHRTVLQKLVYSDAFRCEQCGNWVKHYHSFLRVEIGFFLTPYTQCIRCGTREVHRIAKRDRVDSLSKRPASRLMQLLGAPLNKCPACRLQYYDWRPVER
jgi:uncharacterized Zn finger protein